MESRRHFSSGPMQLSIQRLLESPNMPSRRPVLDDNFETNIPGVYAVGELAGAPVVKLAMEQGYAVAHQIAGRERGDPSILDAIVVGSGAAGLNAALELQKLGLRVIVLEKEKFANTLQDLPEGKWIYTEPYDREVSGPLSLPETSKEELVELWRRDAEMARLDIRTGESVTGISRKSGALEVRTTKGHLTARNVILAIGKSGTVRRLGVRGEELPNVHHKFFSAKPYSGQTVVVIGGGNSAVEAALSLAARHCAVKLIYRGAELYRITKQNARRLGESNIEVIYGAEVGEFTPHGCTLKDGQTVRASHAFVLVGFEPPTAFLHSLGIRLENDWTGNPWIAFGLVLAALAALGRFAGHDLVWLGIALVFFAGLLGTAIRGSRYAWLGISFLTAYTIYGAKQSAGHELWPYTGWGNNALSFGGRSWSFWYTVLYTAVMTIFGIQAMKRWGFDRKDKFQIWRYVSLISFQWIFFFLIPEFLFQYAVKYQWLGEKLASDPNFANNAWRSYGLIYAWPLFFYTFFGNPSQVWIVWGLVLSFLIVPILVLFHGKRYCSWICGCGGLAETLGDRWRHLAPKGNGSIRWERMNTIVLAAAVLITGMMIGRDAVALFRKPADMSLEWYHLIADTWLVGIIPVTLYPFFGGKVWCRYWCPLAKMMEIFSAVFTRFRASHFAIKSTDKCIACGDCSRNCQVGIDVMRFALQQQEITNLNSSCIGCGICVTVCPMTVLSFGRPGLSGVDLVQIKTAA